MDNIIVKKSNIHNIGIFTTKNIKNNIVIGLTIYLKYYIIPIKSNIGKYINHSNNNNCIIVNLNNKYYLKSIKNINKNHELTINYNNTPWFILGTWSI